MTKIVFATRNGGKLGEIAKMLAGMDIDFLSLKDFPRIPEIPEDGNSYLENSLKKAKLVSEYTGEMALADDSGLEVDALGGAPGVYSARYAGEDATDADNVRKLLGAMAGVPTAERGALYQCVLVLYRPGGVYEAFHGSWAGRINEVPLGDGGFGYDPVFFLPEKGITVGQLPADIKNKISHRAQAFEKFKERLKLLLKNGA